MLSKWKIDDKSYEQLWQEVQELLALQESQWNSFQDSDPGITILQGLVELIRQQRKEMERKSGDIRCQIGRLTGFEPRKMRPAETVAAVYAEESAQLPVGMRFFTGGEKLVFESILPQYISSSRLSGVFMADSSGVEQNISHVIWNMRKEAYAMPFSQKPEEGNSLYFFFHQPLERERNISLYFDIYDKDPVRNPLEPEDKNMLELGKLQWEVWGPQGFKPLKVHDETCSLLISGIVSFYVPEEMADFHGRGFCIRATVIDDGFDIPPRLCRIFMNAVRLRQQRTIVSEFSADYDGSNPVVFMVPGAALFKPMVLGADGKGRMRQYEVHTPGVDAATGQNPRRCELILSSQDRFSVDFSRSGADSRPAQGKNTVKVICFDTEYINQINVEGILGYDNQKIHLGITGIVPESLYFLIEKKDERGEPYFVQRGAEEETLLYEADEEQGALVIIKSSFFDDNRLIPCRCQISQGASGRITIGQIKTCSDTRFQVHGNSDTTEGWDKETEPEAMRRLADILVMPVCAVTKEDYETLVMQTPGLCVEHAQAAVEGSCVRIVVKGAGSGKYPLFAPGYRSIIEKHLEQYRLITAELHIEGAVYAPVGVKLAVHCRKQDSAAEELIMACLEEALSSMNKPGVFGVTITRESLLMTLEKLDWVQGVEELLLNNLNENSNVSQRGDILVRSNGVSCCGGVEIIFL